MKRLGIFAAGWLALAASAAQFSMEFWPAGTDVDALVRQSGVCATGASFSWNMTGVSAAVKRGAFAVVRGHVEPRLDGVYRVIAIAQSIDEKGVPVTLAHAACVTGGAR